MRQTNDKEFAQLTLTLTLTLQIQTKCDVNYILTLILLTTG